MNQHSNSYNQKEFLFLRSALTEENPFLSTDDVLEWLKKRNQEVNVEVEKISFSKLTSWKFDENTGDLVHSSGKFFSIQGLKVKTDWGKVESWSQPIINQPEIGYLGIITKEIDGLLYFLMQAKIEPGNVNHVQLSPTLQATRSNYTQVHKGKKPRYLEYFTDENRKVLLDQLQSEQGARFYQKRNRNIIIQVDTEIEPHEDFCWLTLGQLKKLIQLDNIVNMDTRTVISGIPFGNYNANVVNFYNSISIGRSETSDFTKGVLRSMLNSQDSLYSFDDILAWLTTQKSKYELQAAPIPLNQVKDWTKDDMAIFHKDEKYFKVIGVNVKIGNREVVSWCQPLVEPAQEGLCAFLIKEIDGIYHFLVQAKLECGNLDIMELAPTVQCLTDNYKDNSANSNLPYLSYVLNASKEQIKYSAFQSEEGGRFYREQNKNMIILVDDKFNSTIPDNYTWMTLNQLLTFLKFNNYLNIQARSLISAISFI